MHTDSMMIFFKALMPCAFSGFMRVETREASRPNKPASGNMVRAATSKVSEVPEFWHFGK